MEQTNIEEIPEEVLVKIFKFVDKKTLKKVALTCKTWRDLSNEVSWFMHIRFAHFNLDVEACVLESERRFVRLKISDCECDDMDIKNLMEVCTKHGGRVQELRIFQTEVSKSPVFIDILKAMPNLKKCIMFDVSTVRNYADPETAENLPIFEKLETLEMVNCSNRILKCFQKSQLSTLKVFETDKFDSAPPFLDFLATQKNLKSLALRSIRKWTSELFKTPVNDIPFKLNKLSLLDIDLREDTNDYDNLLKFLKIHARTLQKLEIGRIFPAFIFEFIFSEFKQLQSLKISADGIPKDMTLYDRLEVNLCVTKLIVSGGYPHYEYLKAFMRRLPNLVSLGFDSLQSTDMMQFVSTNFPRLRHLEVYTVYNVASDEGLILQIPNLEKLHIQNFVAPNYWPTFTAATNIKELTLESLSNIVDISYIMDNLKLRVLRLGQSIRLNKEFFDNIRQNCVDLKVMRVHKDSLTDIDPSEVKDISALTIYENFQTQFPKRADKDFWNVEDYNGKFPDGYGYDSDDEDSFVNDEIYYDSSFDSNYHLDSYSYSSNDSF